MLTSDSVQVCCYGVVCVCISVCMCVFRGDTWAPFIRRDKVPIFLTITLVGLGKPSAITEQGR